MKGRHHHHRGRLSTEGEEGSEQDRRRSRRISMDWRNMVQSKNISIERQHALSNNTKTEYARASEGKDSDREERRSTDIETSNKTLWQTTTEAINRHPRIWPLPPPDPTDKT